MQFRKWSIVLVIGFALSALCGGVLFADDAVPNAPLQIGIFADLHAHDTDSPDEKKVMIDYKERLEACVEAMNAWPADLVIQLGDLVNGKFVMGAPLGDPARILGILEETEAIYAQVNAPRYYVLGNHDVYDLSKEEFLDRVGASSLYLSFDARDYHIVILDAQYNKKGEDLGHIGWSVQGNIPQDELDWLRDDLAATSKPTIVCIHQPLDVDFDMLSGGPEIFNNEAVKTILEESGVVIAVFQGHDHENNYTLINGIHYLTFEALVNEEERAPSWAYVTLDPVARTITITGEGEQADWELQY
jgi:alkaline phosphatase